MVRAPLEKNTADGTGDDDGCGRELAPSCAHMTGGSALATEYFAHFRRAPGKSFS